MKMRNDCNVNWVTGILGMMFITPAFVLMFIGWAITNGERFEKWMNWEG